MTLQELINSVSQYIPDISRIQHDTPDIHIEVVRTLVRAVLSKLEDTSSITSVLTNFFVYDDLKYYLLKYLGKIFKESRVKEIEVNETYLKNAFNLIVPIKLVIPKKRVKNVQLLSNVELYMRGAPKLMFEVKDDEMRKTFIYENIADVFATAWLNFFSFKLPLEIYKQSLKIMDTQIIPHFKNPLSLSDFLIESVKLGGSASLLALSSLFVLMKKHNLEYPEFYTRLYELLNADILHVKYHKKLFFWTNIFLTSSHLPSYMVAAFVKKLSRLTLTASLDTLLIILPFISNLIIRYPELSYLINKSNKLTVDSDPFDEEEKDFLKCRATDSSLWEIKSLRKHWNEKVVKASSFIDSELPKHESDLSEFLEINMETIKEETFKSFSSNDNFLIDQDQCENLKCNVFAR